MTAARRVDLMSLDDWRALGEDTAGRSELQEGVLIVSPSPVPRHQKAGFRLGLALHPQVPDGVEIVPDVDVIVASGFPPTVRRPDLVIVTASIETDIVAADVVLVVEILSPGTRRQDLVTKRSEYADAGIPHYWIVDLDGGPSIEALRLEDGAYIGEVVTGVLETTVPFDVRVDLTALA
ncbi:Uma2 family endonuclease [Tsukamurella paurometabola]|uniref:Uma2 family endonuclease n=2 Tax=Tsukamurella paurometabola TaxID=2061 RepID=A0ABS5NAW3_TSUPA|nr:Uma2 family endonuclease [Tsukamurella paurometabola]MBS4100792.1 Uma2 family endonuclease [Tsukamurella paurometabola]UEA84648.1 Uma2 family endonuclease [Tsukamurella paurometabola]